MSNQPSETRAQQGERLLQQSWLRLLDNMQEFSAVVDRSGTVLYRNHTSASPAVLIGSKIYDAVRPDDRDAMRAALRRAFQTGEVQLREVVSRFSGVSYRARLVPIVEDAQVVAVFVGAGDISEQRRMEEDRQESEQRLRTLVTNAPVVLFAVDREGVFTVAEGRAMSLVGFKPEEDIGRSVFEMYRDVPGVIDAAHRALAGEAFTATVETGDMVFEAHVSPVRDVDGTITGAVAVATDITDRNRAEKALRESEERFRRLAEDSVDGILLVESSEVRFANAALVQMFGYQSDEEIVGRPFTDFVSSDYRELMVERGRARNEGRDVPDRYEFRPLRRDGSEFDAEISVSTITYQGRRARLGVIKDITERKQAEQALRESEERFRRLSEATLEGIIIHDGGRVLDANSRAAAIHGYELSELIGMDLFGLLAPDCHDLARQQILSGYGESYEVWGLRKDGTTFPMEICAKTASYEGRQVRVGVMRDLTERKRMEEALQRAREDLEARAEQRLSAAGRYNLTFRELTVLYLVAAGMADKEIAFRLGISPRTVSKHVENILQKMGVTSRTEASVQALRAGLVAGAN